MYRYQYNESLKYIINDNINQIKNFNNLTNEDKVFIEEKAKELRERFNRDNFNNEYYNKLLYFVYKTNYSLLYKLSREKKLALIIETIDPNMDMYRIYEDNCNVKYIEEDIRKEFGFYDKDLIRAEKLYIERFYDNSEFSFTKKLEP